MGGCGHYVGGGVGCGCGWGGRGWFGGGGEGEGRGNFDPALGFFGGGGFKALPLFQGRFSLGIFD